jgi:hypothetical protein
MLVRLEDIKGRPYWINPTHVKLIQQDKKGLVTELVMSYQSGFSTSLVIKVDRPIDEVAQLVNAGMPLIDLGPGSGYGDEDSGPDDGGAAMATGLMG